MLKGQNHSPESSIQKEKQMKQPQQITPKGAKTTFVDVWKCPRIAQRVRLSVIDTAGGVGSSKRVRLK
jgi:hypothetical protein